MWEVKSVVGAICFQGFRVNDATCDHMGDGAFITGTSRHRTKIKKIKKLNYAKTDKAVIPRQISSLK